MRIKFVQDYIDLVNNKMNKKLVQTVLWLEEYENISAPIFEKIKNNKPTFWFPKRKYQKDKQDLQEFLNTIDATKLHKAKGALREYQLQILDLAKEIVQIIESWDIHPFLVGGTLLGAVRHKGFIPWDDDADFDVIRSEFQKLWEYAKKHYIYLENDKYKKYNEFLTELNEIIIKNPNQIIFTMKPDGISVYRGTSLNDAASIDFFPRDFINDSFTEETYMKYVNKLRKNKKFETWYEYYKFINENLKDKDIFPITSKKTAKGWGSYAINILNRGVVIDSDKLFPLKPIQFEDTYFNTVADPDNYLKVMYGHKYNLLPADIAVAKTISNFKKRTKKSDTKRKV